MIEYTIVDIFILNKIKYKNEKTNTYNQINTMEKYQYHKTNPSRTQSWNSEYT